jgi:ATP-dependent Clp protease ATP-binding subunit ClpC
MGYLLPALLGFLAGLLAAQAWRRTRAQQPLAARPADPESHALQSQSPPASQSLSPPQSLSPSLSPSPSPSPSPPAPAQSTAAAPPEAAAAKPTEPTPATPPESMSIRLHRLAPDVESFAERSAHPRELMDHAPFREAVQVFSARDVPLSTLREYILGDSWPLSCAALSALQSRSDRADLSATLNREFMHLKPWAIYFGLEYLASLDVRPAVGAPVAVAPSWWAKNLVIPGLFSDHFGRRKALGDEPTFDLALSGTGVDVDAVKALLQRVEHPFAKALLDEIERWQLARVDEAFLRSFGRIWTPEQAGQLLIEPPTWQHAIGAVAASITADARRSVLVTGEMGVGKSSFIRLLSVRLMKLGWTMFEAGAAELMAGQSYIGELEGRIQRLVKEVSSPRRVIWYIPDLLAVASSGSHRGQSASILDQILPAVADRRIVVLAEGSPAGATRVLQSRPALRSLLEIVRLQPATDAEAAVLGGRFVEMVAADLELNVDSACVGAASQLVRQYMSHVHLPGALFDLLKLSAQHCLAAGQSTLTPRALLATLSQVTGLPDAMLNDQERLDLTTVRAFFTSRVIGQDEAVTTVVDRVAMFKAGLTDPSRPLGVFLFAGPTGTGKTELAKTLAEYLFGSAERLVRLDMSEFQGSESMRKIVGEHGDGSDAQSLIQRIRKQPFSVVLLDEFEKSNPNIWDLFLQVFDDGRLSDANGSTADFRHCIIILTSNLGATSHQGRALGFVSGSDKFAPEQVLRTVSQTFRPEFVNRLDRVIVFRPLSRELMRGILRKELRSVLQRRGLRDREWAVEWESSAQEFLLDKGFTPELGARPLRRAIDDHVLAPLATVMVEHRAPQGDQFLFFRSDGHGIQVEFVDPDDDGVDDERIAEGPGLSLISIATMTLQPRGSVAEQKALEAACDAIEARVLTNDWQSLHEELLREMAAANFWSRKDRQSVTARIALFDRVRAAISTIRSLRERLHRSAGRSGHVSRELISRLALQAHLVDCGIQDALTNAPIEVALVVEPTLESDNSAALRDWCRRILEMYQGWAAKRRMQLQAIEMGREVLIISGFGANRFLSEEAGLHIFESDTAADSTSRLTCRVRVAPVPLEHDLSGDSRALQNLLARAPSLGHVVRRYRTHPSPLVRDARHGWRSGKIESVLGGDFDLMGQL